MSEPLAILYRDANCVAIDKPPGLLVHRSPVDSRETEFALQRLRDQIGQRVYPAHRLDRATSGVLMFGLDSRGARRLTEQFERREATKKYIAFVRGFCAWTGVMDRPLADPRDDRVSVSAAQCERPALTEYRTLCRYELPFSDGRHETSRYSLLELIPRTGRRHQLRRHLKHLAHPIIGDTAHGDHRQNHRLRSRLGVQRLLLAATELGIDHPETGQRLRLRAGIGVGFEHVLQQVAPFSVKCL